MPDPKVQPSNRAAVLTGAKVRPLQVSPTPYHTPGPHELLLRNRAVSMNLIDAAKQKVGDMMFGYLKYPIILGNDVTGEVVAVGDLVSRFAPGDRVVAHAMGMDPRGVRPKEGAFQEFVVVRDFLTARLPDSVPFADAAVLPLALSTAACGLFEKQQLNLDRPEVGKKRNGQTLLVWGASTSVGLSAVQLATAAGYDVVGTASRGNWDLVRGLGAGEMFDYRSDTAVEDVARALRKTECAGALAIGDGSLGKCVDIMARVEGARFVSQASIDMPGGGFPEGVLGAIRFVAGMLWGNMGMWFKLKRSGVRSKFIFGGDLVEWDKDDGMVYGYLEKALEAGSFKTSPEPLVVGDGLDKIQEGLDLMMKGVSAQKVVVTLEK